MSRPRLGFVVHLALAAALLPVLPASAATDPIRCDNYEYSMRGERMFWYGNCRDHAQKVSVQFRPDKGDWRHDRFECVPANDVIHLGTLPYYQGELRAEPAHGSC